MKSSSVTMFLLSLLSPAVGRRSRYLPRDSFARRTAGDLADRPGRILRADGAEVA